MQLKTEALKKKQDISNKEQIRPVVERVSY